MSDYITSLSESDRPKQYYALNSKENKKELAKSFKFTYMQNTTLDKQENADETQLIIAPVAKLNQGMGVFAAEDMPYDPQNPKRFGYYKGVIINIKNLDLSEIDTSYYFDDPRDEQTNPYRIDAKTKGNWSRFVNHCENPNLDTDIKHKQIWFMQLREIKKGEQLFINYGDSYDFSGYDKIYLNTNDNWLSIQDYFTHPTHGYQAYDLIIGQSYFNLVNLGFAQGTNQISLPSFYRELLLSTDLSTFDFDNRDWNLPLVGINKRKKLTPKQPYLSLFMLAAFLGREDLIKKILEIKNANLNLNLQQTYTGRTVLYFILTDTLSAELKINLLTLLLNHGACPYLTDFQGKNLFHHCADLNNAEIFEAVLISPKIDLKKAIILIEYPKEECLEHLAKNIDLTGYLLAQKNLSLFKLLLEHADPKKIWENLSGIVPSSHIIQLRYVSNLLNTQEKETLLNFILDNKLQTLAGSQIKQNNTLKLLNACLKPPLEKKKTTQIKKIDLIEKTNTAKKHNPVAKSKSKPEKPKAILPLFQNATRDKNVDGKNKRKIKLTEKMQNAKILGSYRF